MQYYISDLSILSYNNYVISIAFKLQSLTAVAEMSDWPALIIIHINVSSYSFSLIIIILSNYKINYCCTTIQYVDVSARHQFYYNTDTQI